MVAPTRTPQARGAKCDLCKKILATATWLDQTKLAKEVEEPRNVLCLIKQHNTTDCPCIPKSIENLLVGSTHFEIHRLTAKKLDSLVHKKQYECSLQSKQKSQSETPKGHTNEILNDCEDSARRESRFRSYTGYDDPGHIDRSKQQFKHLCRAVDSWRLAMEDLTHPFNAKLALRLGLTHHIIYACYLFKYYKVLDYQLVTANLLLNVFKSIEGVTANAILHAYYLLVKSLIDCDHLQLARQYLKQATRMANYQEKSHYESILLTCAACELGLLDGSKNALDELSDLVYIKPDDKLQHYYARTLAMTLIIRYIHIYPQKTDNCHEFFHAFRFICAIMRRCYDSSFDIVLLEKNSGRTPSRGTQDKTQVQILDHSWIRFAVCDFVFATFDLLSEFYTRAGMPECLELIYNALALISYRNGSLYWQSRILAIGTRLDLLCDKYESARAKVDISSRLVGYSDDPYLMNIIRLHSELGLLQLINQQESVITPDVIDDILDRTKACKSSLMERLAKNELYDAKSSSHTRVNGGDVDYDLIVLGGYIGKISLTTLNVGIVASIRQLSEDQTSKLMTLLRNQMKLLGNTTLEYYVNQQVLEMLLQLTGVEKSEQLLLDTLPSSPVFMETDDKLLDLQSQLSSLTLNSEADNKQQLSVTAGGDMKRTTTSRSKRSSRMPLSRRSKRKGLYEVAIRSEENLSDVPVVRLFNVMETMVNFVSLSKEEVAVSYLRNSEPNPDFDLYRRAHELMLCHRLSDAHMDQEAILYHMSESVTANTLRYRWMMYEEQNSAPFDQSSHLPRKTNASPIKHLSFCNALVNQANVVKSMTRTVPDETRLVQLKYIYDKRSHLEHLLCVALGPNHEPVYVHSRRSLSSEDIFTDSTDTESDTDPQLTIPNRLRAKIEQSKLSLLSANNRSRSNTRRDIESGLGVVLHDAENDWFGPFRFLLCGRITDANYNNFIGTLASDVLANIMGDRPCRSPAALRMLLEYAPLLRRDEFCQALGTMFNCDSSSEEVRDGYNKWLKSLEANMRDHNIEMNKTAFLMQLERSQVGLILDNKLELIPFESLPVARTIGQGVFRVPSLRLFSIMATRRCLPIKIDPNEIAYMLDPAHNLPKTRERFDSKLRGQEHWVGTIGCPPRDEELEAWLTQRQLYLFIGHGAGTAYYNKLCKGRGLGHMQNIESAAIIMGCSSGRMMSEGSRLESFGIGWLMIFQGSPCYLGLLWDVTDSDIDKFLDSMLDKWMPDRRWSSVATQQARYALTTASTLARQVCQLKLLVGASPVIYGLPIWCKD